MVPHILFHNTRTNYYPNYTAWNCGNKIHSSGITQPPILATILKEILNKNSINKTQLLNIKKIILKIKKFHEWLIQFRDPKKSGLVSILHPWESGYDNSPIWDEPMEKVTIEKNLKYKKFEISEKKLTKFFEAFRNNKKFKGFNVTIPYKTNFISLCDKTTPKAKKIGSVNLVYKKNNLIIGDNTDVIGFEKSFKKLKKIFINNRKFPVLLSIFFHYVF